MSVTTFDPAWRGRALRFRIPDVVGQVLIAAVGAFIASFAAFELTMIAGAWLSGTDPSARHHECGLYAVVVIMMFVPAMIVAVIPNIVWSCWQRRLSWRRALLAPPAIGLATFGLIGLGYFSMRNALDVVAQVPGIALGCLVVALAMFGWHRLWMRLARRHAARHER